MNKLIKLAKFRFDLQIKKISQNLHFNFSEKIKINHIKDFIDNQNKNKEVLITTPIFYVNSHPHIGHLYTAILASAIKEVNLIQNKKVFLSTGTDEHGLKIQQKAKENNIDALEFCNQNSKMFRELFDYAKINYDDYIRTTEYRHMDFVRNFWNKLQKLNKIKSSSYSGYYSISDESFIPEKDLIQDIEGNLKTKLNQPVEYISEENFSLNFSEDNTIEDYKQNLFSKRIEFQPESIKNEVTEYIKQKLFEICISRPYKRVNWGIKVPNNENHVMYVWFEALLNYLTVTESLNLKLENLEMINLIGKDISKFHCYFWPLLLQISNKMPNKLKIIMHHHWLKSDLKMSKSIGNVVNPFHLLNLYGLEAIRFYFLSSGPQNHDVNFEENSIREIFYKYIPDTLTNLLLRLSNPSVCNTNFYKSLEEPFNKEELEKLRYFCEMIERAKEAILSYDFISATHKIHLILIELNAYVHSTQFWKNLNNKNYVSKIFCVVFENLRIVSILLKPFLPELAISINKFIGNNENRINLTYCWFRINLHQMLEIYEEEQVMIILSNNDLKVFYDEINSKEKGYFNIDLNYKENIFIRKVKIEKEINKKNMNKNKIMINNDKTD